MTAKTRATRAGFTLVEMLMVIAIIAILAALLFAGLTGARKKAREVQARNDIQQLDATAATFKRDFGFYPPSHVLCTRTNGTNFVARFMVPSNLSGTLTGDTGLQNDASLIVLQRMFPRWTPTPNTTNPSLIAWQTTPMQGLAGKTLSPNASLVLFLAGPGTNGWQTAAPEDSGTSATKKGPYFDFPQGRLINQLVTNGVGEFVDPWGTPYAYFAASGDSYDARVMFPWAPAASGSDAAPATYDGTAVGNDPNKAGTFTAHPYGSNGKWLNPGKVQIVSAGPDKLFGPGSVIAPANTPPVNTTAAPMLVHLWDAKNPQGGAISSIFYGEGGGGSAADRARGADDLANFNEGSALGTGNAP